MTPPMVSRARDAARRMGIKNVEFRLGEIERLPVADASVDVIMSNCVLNLSPEKPAVLGEAARVLRSGGRLAISDVVLLRPLPPALAAAAEALTGCVSGAATVEELGRWLEEAGFVDVKIEPKPESRQFIKDWFPGSGAEEYVASAMIVARRP
jgi:ubiquinone/menaquinone biosynthesis C-methylase UbiE